MTTRVIELIFSDAQQAGDGTHEDPVRVLRSLFTLDGRLVACQDNFAPERDFLNISEVEK